MIVATRPSPRSPWSSVVEWLVLVLGAWYVLAYIAVALMRMRYPYELEWMEGAIVEQVRQVAAGHRLYVAPSIDFIPFQYPPLFFYAGALVSKVAGIGFFPLRLLSFLASLGCFAIIFAMVRKESGSTKGAFLAVSLFAACFRADGAWYDLARIDSLCLLLVLAAAYLVRFHAAGRASFAAVILLALAFFTKQSALLMAVPLLGYLVVRSWREGALALIAFAALVGLATWALNRAHHGWYVYYVFRMPARMQQIDPVSVNFWKEYILGPVAIAFAMAVGYMLRGITRDAMRQALFYPLLALGMIGSAWLSMLHAGAYYNNLIPAYAVISILFGLAAADVMRPPYVAVLCAVQLLLLFYDPRLQVPDARSREAGGRLVSLIAATPGEVLLPQHGYLAALAGKRSFAHSMAVYDVLRAGSPNDASRLVAQYQQAFAARRFGAVIVDRLDPWVTEPLERSYRRGGAAIADADAFWPVTGLRIRPEWIYLPR
jgi:dolichyl-phosphate-mannose-protein mannosyltransferase